MPYSMVPRLWQTTYKRSNGSSKTEMTLNYKSQPHDHVLIILNGYWNLKTE
jgi:hypothetical protein